MTRLLISQVRVRAIWAAALTAALFCDVPSATSYEPTTLRIGDSAPDFDLLAVDGNRYSLADFADKEVFVVIFTTNHCPDAIASYGRMCRMVDEYRNRNVAFVAINGNDPEAVCFP